MGRQAIPERIVRRRRRRTLLTLSLLKDMLVPTVLPWQQDISIEVSLDIEYIGHFLGELHDGAMLHFGA